MTGIEQGRALGDPPVIGGTYPATASAHLRVCAGGKDLSLLAPAVTKALQDAGLSACVGDGSLTVAGIYEARIPEYRMDEAIWSELTCQGYGLASVAPVRVRNVFSGGQHGGGKPRMYMYEDPTVFVAKGEGSDTLMDKVRGFVQKHPYSPPDFDQIVACIIKPEYLSQRWAPLMSDTRDLVGRALFTGQGVPDITYFADSMIAMIEGDKGLEYISIPNADGEARYVKTWKQLPEL